MSITSKPKRKTPEAFIAGAPDAVKPPAKGVMRGTRRQIALTLPPETVDRIDTTARRYGMTRAAYINQAVARALESDAR